MWFCKKNIITLNVFETHDGKVAINNILLCNLKLNSLRLSLVICMWSVHPISCVHTSIVRRTTWVGLR